MIKPLFLALAAAVLAQTATAAPLASATAVHTRPDTSAPTITFLKAGVEPGPISMQPAPLGWLAIELSGPFEAYVENKDLLKSLDVKPGAAIRLAPKADAGILTAAEPTDKSTITGLHGKWTQISLERKIVGYVNIGAAGTLSSADPASSAPTALAPAPISPTAYGVGTQGQPAPVVSLGDHGSLPRQFAGRFVSTRRPLMPRRPYDYALNDDAGKRYAYLDLSRLLLAEEIEKYLDHSVVVFGAAKSTADGKEIVIEVETLQLR
jgi:hypothetical protein